MPEALNITTANVLHPRQVVELRDTKAALQGILAAPQYVRDQLQDKGALVSKQIVETDKMLEQAPQPIPADQIDDAVKLEAELRDGWLKGMPTQAEMCRNSPGCVDKNMAWSRRHKADVLRWKQLRRRLHASGISEHRQADEGDISNIELFRPVGGSQELSMDNAQIPQTKTIYQAPPGAGPAVVMSDEQAALLKSIDPEVHVKMALLDNATRAAVLEFIDGQIASQVGQGAGEAQVAPSRPVGRPRGKKAKRAKAVKRPRSEKQLANDARMSEQAKARNAARAKPAADGG